MVREEQGSILGSVMPKNKKVILDASWFNTQHKKVWIKGKWSNPQKEVAPSPTPAVAIEKGAFGSSSTTVGQHTHTHTHTHIHICWINKCRFLPQKELCICIQRISNISSSIFSSSSSNSDTMKQIQVLKFGVIIFNLASNLKLLTEESG